MLPRAQYETAAVGIGGVGKEFDMVDFAAVIAADPGGFQPCTYGPRILGKLRNLGGFEGEGMIVDEENQLPPVQYHR